MYFSLMGKLNARRNGLLSEEEKGFTLIELLVVVIIIGILAAIAIPVYLSVQKNSEDSAVQSDVTNFKTAVVSAETNLGGLPESSSWTGDLTAFPTATVNGTAATDTQSWQGEGASSGKYTKSITYTETAGTDGASDTFCVLALSTTGNYFFATDAKGVAKGTSSSCDGTTTGGTTTTGTD